MNIKVFSKSKIAYICDPDQCDNVEISNARYLDFSIKSNTPVIVNTHSNVQIVVRTPWHLFLACLFTDYNIQDQVLRQPTYREAQRVASYYQSSMREDINVIKTPLMRWVTKLHVAMRYQEMLSTFPKFSDLNILYVRPNKKRKFELNNQMGCIVKSQTDSEVVVKYLKNSYGCDVKTLVRVFNKNPQRFLVVPPPQIETVDSGGNSSNNFMLLGLRVSTYVRDPKVSDAKNLPKDRDILSLRNTKSATETFLEA